MEARAVSRFIRISPRKARLVANLIRGKNIEEALAILAVTPKKASPILRKAVLSATANVRDRDDADRRKPDSEIFITEIRIDEGPTLKRIRPRAQGRAFRINKRTSHINVTVGTQV
ncbi:MAG: 50S ribosomal protein L22 [Gemmatimonadales bacterium]|nr:50S ribosomal protein L22 [Gemmatimonadales bacterium]